MIPTHIACLGGATFIIPLRVDSIERVRNAAYVISYLTTKLGASVIVEEVDTHPKFGAYGFRFLASILPPDANLQYLFKAESRQDGVFHRTRALNDMILRTTTPVVVNYDADVLLPLDSYHAAVNRLLAGRADVVYPYALGSDVQRKVFASSEVMIEFAAAGYQLNILNAVSCSERAAFGHCQFFRREAYISGYLENENFVSYGPEDVERYWRFLKFGYRIERLGGPIYHLEHPRTPNSSPANPYMASNMALWERLREMPPDALYAYYESQPYVWARRRNGLNGAAPDLSRALWVR